MFKNIVILTQLFLCIIPCTASIAFKLPDTGQSKCYQAVDPYAEIPCDGTGQDGAYSINPMSYSVNNDGTVTDNNTGLMWQKEDDNQTYNWYQATGTYHATYNANPQQNVCGSLTLGGHSDWRLPTKKELISIVDYSISYPGPSINQTNFPNTKASSYWSSTTYAGITNSRWEVDFDSGYVYYSYGTDAVSYVRCVRGGQIAQTFTDNGNGTVTDNRTGLIWQQSEPGLMTLGQALPYCEGLSLGGNVDWRLPNIRELESLTDDTKYSPAINTSFFPDAYPSYFYHSSTTGASATRSFGFGSNVSWAVVIDSGRVTVGDKGFDGYVRCVRGGESGSLLTAWIVGTAKYFNRLQEAHDGAGSGNTIEAEAGVFTESFTVSKELIVRGGYDSSYSGNAGYTTLQGGLTVQNGPLMVENLVIM